MQTSDGFSVASNANSANTMNDARHALTAGSQLTTSKAEFLYLVECQGCQELSGSLKMIHDLALLHQYTYRTELSWWIFALSGIGALVVTLLTVSFQSIKAALMNPVKSLRME